jgi:phosphoglycolate phosphatase
MAYDVILFDIDGTLCNPGSSITESARHALSELGIHETDEQALRRFVGPPLEHSFRDYYNFDEDTTNRAVGIFRTKLKDEGMKLYRAYDGIPELLSELSKNGRTLGIVTSKMENIARMVLESTDLIEHFVVISAQQPNEVVKKEKVLSKAMQELDITSNSSVVMVGDRMHDVEAANTHDIESIGVLYGYGSLDELTNEGATYLAKDADDLRRLLI